MREIVLRPTVYAIIKRCLLCKARRLRMNQIVALPLAVILYNAALIALVIGFRGLMPMRRAEQLAILLALPASAIHAVLVWQNLYTAAGIDLAVVNAASLVGWLTGITLIIASLRQPVISLGVVIFPLAAVTLALASLTVPSTQTLVPIGAAVDIHIISSVLAYSIFALATAQALLLAWQDHALRRRQPDGLLGVLPPLQVMEALLFQLLVVGFVLLSFALLTGWLFVDNLLAQDLVHKTVISGLAWIVFAIVLIGRYFAGWRGRTAVRGTLAGFLLLALAYFGSKVVLELILGR
mgnify:CR=1 FL=1